MSEDMSEDAQNDIGEDVGEDIGVVFDVDSGRFGLTGPLDALDPDECMGLAMILARAAREQGAAWPVGLDEESLAEVTAQRGLQAGLGEEQRESLAVKEESFQREERIERLLNAMHDTRAELHRVMYLAENGKV